MKQEATTTTRNVPAVRGDIYKVISKGVNIEWTDRIQEAQSAYREAGAPKTMFKITRGTGAVTKLQETNF